MREDAFNEIIKKIIENEGNESTLHKLKTFIDDIENEKNRIRRKSIIPRTN